MRNNMTTKNKLELLEIDEWEIKAWITRLGSMPIKVIDRCDRSAPFSITRFTILKLEDGKYATIDEQGCSCYIPENANIEIFSTEKRAKTQLEKWNKLMNEYNNPCVCGKHTR